MPSLRSKLYLLLVLALPVPAATAQVPGFWEWFLFDGPPPAHLVEAAAVSLPSGHTIQIGGLDTNLGAKSTDTYVYYNRGWSKLSTTGDFEARIRHAAAYFRALGTFLDKVLVFGGLASGTVSDDTWCFDFTEASGSWVKATPANSPSARSDHSMAYDAKRGKVVLFGGADGSDPATLFNDTWEWDGVNWQQVNTAVSPPARFDSQMVYDESMGCILLFGGGDHMFRYGDTWRYDGNNWEQLNPQNSPSPRIAHAMAYHPDRERTVLFGGFSPSGQDLGDTWEFDSSSGNWNQTQFVTQPMARLAPVMAYDSVRREMILNGGVNVSLNMGFNDSWALFSTMPATYENFGMGCAGSAGIPTLNAAPHSWPWIENTFTLQLDNLPLGNGSAFVIFGFSNTNWAGIPLPADLSPVGIWGCTAYVSADIAFPVATASGTAEFAFQIPTDTSLVNVEFYNQGVVMDPGVNFAGLTVTNAGKGVLGQK